MGERAGANKEYISIFQGYRKKETRPWRLCMDPFKKC
jgi:hypothetical protein